MGESKIIRPNSFCQEEVWKTIYGITAELNYIDNAWFPTVIRFTVARDSVIIQDESTQNSIELRKGMIIIVTRPCIMSVSKYEIMLRQCDSLSFETGRWIWFDKNVVPFLSKEYIEAGELYERVRHIFKVLAGHITDKLGF
jgi:hypothetical protein